MKTNQTVPIWQLSQLFALSLLLSACVSYQSNSALSRIQNPEGIALMDQIQSGKTEAGWLRARIGQPSSITHTQTGSELWRYENIQATDKELSLLPLIKITHRDQQIIQFWFEIEAGRVVRYWTQSVKG